MHDEDPPITRVLAVRHAETAWNVDVRLQGQLDIPLNAHGHWQAARLASALADEQVAAIYSSDLARARDTAQAIAAGLGLELRLDTRLRERLFGAFQGCTHEEIAQRWPDDARRWRERDPEFGPAGGETLAGFHARCVQAVHQLAAAHAGQAIVVVAHGGVLDCLYRAAAGLELSAPRTWTIGNASINRLLCTPQGLTILTWADARHLEEQGALDDDSVGDGVGDRGADQRPYLSSKRTMSSSPR